MISLDPKDLMREIEISRDWLKPVLQKSAEVARRLAGEHYRNTTMGDTEGGELPRTPENYPFSYKLFVGVQILYGAPSCRIRPVRRFEDRPTADALELAVNTWALETDAETTLDELLDDAFVGFGVGKVGVEARGHYSGTGLTAVEGDFEQRPNYPFMVRVDPRHFIVDRAWKLSRCRFIGELFERDLEDVQADDRYDEAARMSLTERGTEDDPTTETFPENVRAYAIERQRKRVNLYELYLPEHGRIITLAETGPQPVILRNEEYFGPDEGPYTLWGLTSVPGELLPLSPLVALWDEFLELQQHAADMADSAATHKKIGIGPTGADEDAKTIRDAKNGGMYLVNNPDQIHDFEIGGASDTQMSFTAYLRARLDRNLGFSDAQRGVVNGDSTATEANLASASSDLRVDSMSVKIRRSVKASYRKIAWYFENDASIGQMPLIRQDPITGQQQAGTFIAGKWDGGFVNGQWIEPQPDNDLTDFLFDVDPQMGKQDDAIKQKRAQDRVQLLASLAPVIPTAPYINWQAVLDDYGKAFNDPYFAERVLITQMPMMGQPAPMASAGMWPTTAHGGANAGATMTGLMANAGTALGGNGAAASGGNGGGNSPYQSEALAAGGTVT